MSEKTIVVKCRDGKTFEIDEATASMSGYIKFELKHLRRHLKWKRISLNRLPVNLGEDCRVPSELVEKVLHYCERHAHTQPDDDLTAFDAQFIDVDPQLLSQLAGAADKLRVHSLYQLAAGAMCRFARTKDDFLSIVRHYRHSCASFL